ncbi:tetratricopeptide repeat protein [Zavarzinella formosa]|uniref:tetratricopeptide repeat protein n=1 Tax=Zavarzinella formosa TaxID=360055 RepID=UPI00030791BA|nr:tetratricopeptide repeat protein [Zavarzinella formosa]
MTLKKSPLPIGGWLICMIAFLTVPAVAPAYDPLNPDDTGTIQKALREQAKAYLDSKPEKLAEMNKAVGEGVAVTLDPSKIEFTLKKDEAVITWIGESAKPLTEEQKNKWSAEVAKLVQAFTGQVPNKDKMVIFPQAEWDKLVAQKNAEGKANPFVYLVVEKPKMPEVAKEPKPKTPEVTKEPTPKTPEVAKVFSEYAVTYLAGHPLYVGEISKKVGEQITLDPTKATYRMLAGPSGLDPVIRWPYHSAKSLSPKQTETLRKELKGLVQKITGNHPTKSQFFSQDQWNALLAQEKESETPNPKRLNPFDFPAITDNGGDGDPITYRPQTYRVDEGWYLPGFGYVPPWPHTLPRHTGSERFMGYLTETGLHSPFLDALDAGQVRWFYPPHYRATTTATAPVMQTPINVLPSPIPPVKPEDRPAIPAELTGRDAASLRTEGTRLLKGNRPVRALSVLTAATERDTDDVAAWYLRAVAERELGQMEQATESARRAQALELLGRDDSVTVARALENVQGPSRKFITEAAASLTVAEARVIVAKPILTGLAAKTK